MISTLLIGSFLIAETFFSQRNTFSRNLNHHWKCRKQNETFQTILVITFWKFTIFLKRPYLPQVKRNLTYTIAD